MNRERLVNRTFETRVGDPLVFLETGNQDTLKIRLVREPWAEGAVWEVKEIINHIEEGNWTLHEEGDAG